MNHNLKDKVALVTGSSRGLGAAMVTKLAEDGAQVAINYVNNEEGAQGVKEAITAKGGQAEIFKADVTDENGVAYLCEEVKRTFGEVDILVLNATCHHRHLPIEELTWPDMLEMMDFFRENPDKQPPFVNFF